jgi:hypothetical protein
MSTVAIAGSERCRRCAIHPIGNLQGMGANVVHMRPCQRPFRRCAATPKPIAGLLHILVFRLFHLQSRGFCARQAIGSPLPARARQSGQRRRQTGLSGRLPVRQAWSNGSCCTAPRPGLGHPGLCQKPGPCPRSTPANGRKPTVLRLAADLQRANQALGPTQHFGETLP